LQLLKPCRLSHGSYHGKWIGVNQKKVIHIGYIQTSL
jgi:hypothetical protein